VALWRENQSLSFFEAAHLMRKLFPQLATTSTCFDHGKTAKTGKKKYLLHNKVTWQGTGPHKPSMCMKGELIPYGTKSRVTRKMP
jgi:hypothetical protein